MKYIPEARLREICSEINGTFGLYVSLSERGEKLPLIQM